MKRSENPLRWLLLFCLLLSLKPAFSQKVKVAPVPSWVQAVPTLKGHDYNSSQVSSGYYTTLTDVQTNVPEQLKYVHGCRVFLSNTGVQNGAEIGRTYDPAYQQLVFHKLIIWRDGKAINKLQPSKFKVIQRESDQDAFMYDGALTAFITLEDVRPGDVLEYAYSVKGFNPLYKDHYTTQFYINSSDPIDEVNYRFIFPADKKIYYKLLNNKEKPAITKKANQTIYSWQLKDVPAREMEDQTPSWYDPYQYIIISDYPSWDAVRQWALPLYNQPDHSKALDAEATSIKHKYSTKDEQLMAALHFVQNDIRYVGIEGGIGAYKPRKSSVILKQRFGDCKDKALLLCNLLRQLDIDAAPALVNTYSGTHVADKLPAPDVFNHCIVRVNYKGGTYWYDATDSYQGGLYNSTYLPDYGKALVIDSTSHGLQEIKNYHIRKTVAKEYYTIRDFGDTTPFEIKTKYYGGAADDMRYYFANNTINDISREFLNFYAHDFPDIKKGDSIRTEDDLESNIFTIHESYRIPQLFAPDDTDQLKHVAADFFPRSIYQQFSMPEDRARKMPIAIAYPDEYQLESKVYLPENHSFKHSLVHEENDAFNYRQELNYDPATTTLTIDYDYKSLSPLVASRKSAAYETAVRKVRKKIGYRLSFNKGITDAFAYESGGGHMSYITVLLALLTIGIMIFASKKLYHYDPVPAPAQHDYGNNIDGWLLVFVVLLGLNIIGAGVDLLFKDASRAEYASNYLQNGAAFGPLKFLVITIDFLLTIALEIFEILILVLIVQRRSNVPKLVRYLLIFKVIQAFIKIYPNYIRTTSLTSSSGLGIIIAIMIILVATYAAWYTYFKNSDRVKAAFTRRLQPEADAYEDRPADVADEDHSEDIHGNNNLLID